MGKIVLFTHGKVNPYEESGMSRVVYYLAKHLKLRGKDIEILSVVDGMRKPKDFQRDNYVSLKLFPRVVSLRALPNNSVRKYLDAQSSLIDLVHMHLMWFPDKISVIRDLLRMNIPYVVTAHGAYTADKTKLKWYKKMLAKYVYELWFLNKSNVVVAQTPEELTELRNFGVRAPIYLSSIGIDEEEIPENKDKEYLNREYKAQGKVKFGWVGNLIPVKNLHNLIRALSYLPEGVRKNIAIFLIGSVDKDKTYVAFLKSQIKELRLEKQIHFLGPLYREAKYKIIHNLDAYVHVSTSETISLAALEAMTCAKPLIISRTSQVSYLYDRNFFIMVEPWYDHIAKGILDFLSLPQETIKDMGKRAKDIALREFSWDRVADKYIKIFENIKKVD